MPDARRIGRWAQHHDDRGAGRRRPAASGAGGLPRPRRLPMRLLHAGTDHVGRRPAGRGPRDLATTSIREWMSGNSAAAAPIRTSSPRSRTRPGGPEPCNRSPMSGAHDVAGAIVAADQPGADYLAGGTDMLQLMKDDVAPPAALVDINGLAELSEIGTRGGRIAPRRARPHERRRRPSGGAPLLSRDRPGASRQRIAAAAQHGDGRRQHPAAHALRLFPRRRDAVQQARAGHGLRRARRREPDARGARRQRQLHRDATLGHGGGAGRARRGGRASQARRASGVSRSTSFHALPGPDARARDGAGAGRADRRGRGAGRCRWRSARTIARCATARRTSSRSSRPPSRSTIEGGTIREARIALGGVGTKPWRAHDAERALVGAQLRRRALRSGGRAGASPGARPLERQRLQDRAGAAQPRARARRAWRHEHGNDHRRTARPRRRAAQGHRAGGRTPPR